ncbi:glycosyltransferase family 4 protein [Pedobacter sp. SYSU D00535]|uniref:glycosyltransferase family 4 protein n=1 Tax=Pedobacter sp. SYSU D00535 TaxID=2810308 RepID=UPI001A970162|nr:glycosyltransferase family 4 protein [Pedobacter sp. SYSU D00535]
MKETVKILYLYSELGHYQIPIFQTLVKEYSAQISVVHWDSELIRYSPAAVEGVKYYKRSAFNRSDLFSFVADFQPSLVYTSGWMDRDYLAVCRWLKKNNTNCKIVAGCDTPWRGSFRQNIARLISRFYLRRCFTHIWVAGPLQFEYAKRLGFGNSQIIFDCLTANTNLFLNEHRKKNGLLNLDGKKFLYVGRFSEEKGVQILLEAFSKLERELKHDWKLVLVGQQEHDKIKVVASEKIIVKPFLPAEQIIEIANGCSVFILPSISESWGLVLHEFAALGLPLLTSDICGANFTFLIPGYNGLKFKNGDMEDLADKLKKFVELSDLELNRMGQNSEKISRRISVDTTVGNLVSVLVN